MVQPKKLRNQRWQPRNGCNDVHTSYENNGCHRTKSRQFTGMSGQFATWLDVCPDKIYILYVCGHACLINVGILMFVDRFKYLKGAVLEKVVVQY